MDCGDSERLVLYAAGALDPGEEAEVADHLHRGCAGCEAQLAEAEILLAGLAMPEEPIDPPVGLKRRVLTRIGRLELEEAPAPDPINAAPETVAFGDRSGQPRAFGIMGRSHRLRKAAAPALSAAVAVVMTYGAMTFFADAPAERELRALRA
jgi:hypothetical protein